MQTFDPTNGVARVILRYTCGAEGENVAYFLQRTCSVCVRVNFKINLCNSIYKITYIYVNVDATNRMVLVHSADAFNTKLQVQ